MTRYLVKINRLKHELDYITVPSNSRLAWNGSNVSIINNGQPSKTFRDYVLVNANSPKEAYKIMFGINKIK